MLAEKQIQRMYQKLTRFEKILEPLIFRKEETIGDIVKYETTDRLYEIPDDSLFIPAEVGSEWGGEESFCWYKAEFTVPDKLDGDRKSTRLNSSHTDSSRMPSSA